MAADKRFLHAMFIYGRKLLDGDNVPMNKKEASRYLKIVADNNIEFTDDAACFYGRMLYLGDGIDQNKSEAVIYYKKAADLVNSTAMFIYGTFLLSGNRVEKKKKHKRSNSLYNDVCSEMKQLSHRIYDSKQNI